MLFYSYDDFTQMFGNDGAILLVLCGVMTLIWFFYEGVRRGFFKSKKEEWELDKVSKALKIIILLGIALGVFVIVVAITTMVAGIPPSEAYAERYELTTFDWLTSISLLVLGLCMFVKPLIDIPWATIVGMIAGVASALVLAVVIPEDVIAVGSQYVNMKWVLLGVFIVVATFVGMALKFWINGIETISKILSWPPVALLVSIYCFIQGFGLWFFGWSIYVF